MFRRENTFLGLVIIPDWPQLEDTSFSFIQGNRITSFDSDSVSHNILVPFFHLKILMTQCCFFVTIV